METKASDTRSQDAWWAVLGTLYRKRRFILVVTGFAAIASVVISLLLPKWYQSTAAVILPTGGSGGGLSALLGNLDPAAASLLGSGGGDYVRYMAILTSRSMTDRVINAFNLMDVYETRDSPAPWRDTRRALASNVDFALDQEFDYLKIGVFDKDPQRATDMANFFVGELNIMNTRLQSENAASYRRFVERRYFETIASLDSAMIALQTFQEKYGLLELEQQTGAFLEVLAQYRVAAFESEVEYEGLVLDFGENNPMVRSAYNRVQAAREKERKLLEGEDPLMPIAVNELPEVARRYAAVMREVLIFEKIIEFARPLLEQAIFEEQKDSPAVQVLDEAVVPEWKSKPKRAFIIVGITVSVFILTLIYVILMDWLRRNRGYLARRIQNELQPRQ